MNPTEQLDGSTSALIVIQDKPRGFGFVEMDNDGEGEKAIAALNGTTVDGRALNINEARPKTERGGAAGGGFRKRW